MCSKANALANEQNVYPAYESKHIRGYIAGPLFTPAERQWLEQIDKVVVEHGIITILPHRDVGLTKDIGNVKAFTKDLFEITASNIVIACLDGIDIDSGTACEIGYAQGRSISVVGVSTDLRRASYSNNFVQQMCLGSLGIVGSLRHLSSVLDGWIRMMQGYGYITTLQSQQP